jgi:carboxyvinyl-carboxyphosphonate phosphorylmutase
MADAVERLRAYQETGVDGVFVTGVKTRADVEALARVAKLPILLGGAPQEIQDRSFLAAHGVRVALQGHLPFAAAIAAIAQTMQALRDGQTPPAVASADMMDRLSAGPLWRGRIEAFLKPGPAD